MAYLGDTLRAKYSQASLAKFDRGGRKLSRLLAEHQPKMEMVANSGQRTYKLSYLAVLDSDIRNFVHVGGVVNGIRFTIEWGCLVAHW